MLFFYQCPCAFREMSDLLPCGNFTCQSAITLHYLYAVEGFGIRLVYTTNLMSTWGLCGTRGRRRSLVLDQDHSYFNNFWHLLQSHWADWWKFKEIIWSTHELGKWNFVWVIEVTLPRSPPYTVKKLYKKPSLNGPCQWNLVLSMFI